MSKPNEFSPAALTGNEIPVVHATVVPVDEMPRAAVNSGPQQPLWLPAGGRRQLMRSGVGDRVKRATGLSQTSSLLSAGFFCCFIIFFPSLFIPGLLMLHENHSMNPLYRYGASGGLNEASTPCTVAAEGRATKGSRGAELARRRRYARLGRSSSGVPQRARSGKPAPVRRPHRPRVSGG